MRTAHVAGLLAGLAGSFGATTAHADIIPVSNSQGLLDAIAVVAPGDEIVLADGTYAIGQNVNCSTAGTPSEPIVVRAENPLGARIEFDALEGFKVDAPHWHFEDLEIVGVCASDPNCEHAFHVVGQADGFVMRRLRVLDFNAQLKVNAQEIGGTYYAPNDGLIELCDIGDTDGRQTSSPVTKLNIDGGVGWVVRDNYIHDFQKDGGNGVSYGAFMKSGGEDGVFERNLVICDAGASNGGTRIGLSFGGGGTANQFCAPAYDAGVECDPEHTNGTMRNNIITSCNDVGIYLNKATNTELLYNTLIGTAGIDFRFVSSTGLADGNVLASTIDNRDGGTHTAGINLENVTQGEFDTWYTDPLAGDLTLLTEPTELIGQGDSAVTDDYCVRDRPGANLTLGALEHSLGSCETFPPPGSGGAGGASGGAGGMGSGGDASGGMSAGSGAAASGGSGPTASGGSGADGGSSASGDSDDGCGCRTAGASASSRLAWLMALGGMVFWSRRRRSRR